MAYYLIQAAYTSEAWAAMLKKPQNRPQAIRPIIEKLGGTLENMWLCFGEYDVVAICRFPDTIGAVAFAVAGTAGGAIKTMKTTPLVSFEDGMEAMKKAGQLNYKPPQKI